jgi:hypothetical protein
LSSSYTEESSQNLVYKNNIKIIVLLIVLSSNVEAYEKLINFNNIVMNVVIVKVKNTHWRMYEIKRLGDDLS